MLGITHALIGVSLCRFFNLAEKPLEVTIALVFAVLPDIDHPNSFFGTVLRPITLRIYSKLGHRNFTHSAFFMTACLTPFLATPYFNLVFTAIGSHLIGDSLTYSGIPLLWPYKKNFTFLGGPIKTGTFVEAAICIICIGFLIHTIV